MAEGGYDPKLRGKDPKGRPVCRFYLRNNCRRGGSCDYRHVKGEQAQVNDVCKYYQLGNCAYGKNCKFMHVKSGKQKDCLPGQNKAQSEEAGRGSKPVLKELPSRMVTLKKENPNHPVHKSERGKTKMDYNNKWAQAEDFVPGKKFHGSVPSSYANAVQPHRKPFVYPADAAELLCPFFEQTGRCPFEGECQYAHAFICEFCSLPKLHPVDEKQREKHIKECLQEHERQMEHAFAVQASSDKECGICLENVVDKGQGGSHVSSNNRFGILENCNHCFCLSCIRTWRQNKSDVIQTQRTCPTCRTHSDFVTPSKYWVESPTAKRKLIDDYKKAMSVKNCQYFKRGKGECPFDDRCFYKHALEDGTIVRENIHRRRRRTNAEGERDVEEDYSLWDYITQREEDEHELPLDAQLSLLLLGMFEDSDDDDNNNSFAWRYNFLNGDFYFTDSDTETDSD